MRKLSTLLQDGDSGEMTDEKTKKILENLGASLTEALKKARETRETGARA